MDSAQVRQEQGCGVETLGRQLDRGVWSSGEKTMVCDWCPGPREWGRGRLQGQDTLASPMSHRGGQQQKVGMVCDPRGKGLGAEQIFQEGKGNLKGKRALPAASLEEGTVGGQPWVTRGGRTILRRVGLHSLAVGHLLPLP